MKVLCDRRMWSADRLHLNSEGHRRVSLFVAETAGVPVTADWARAPWPSRASLGQHCPGQVPRPVAGAARGGRGQRVGGRRGGQPGRGPAGGPAGGPG